MSKNTGNGDDQKPKAKPVSKRQKQKVIDGFNIFTTPATHEDLVFIARELVLCTLPHSDPGNVPLWRRTNGNLTLGIQPGMNIKTGESYGYPYGTIPRLLLIWIVTEVLRTRSRRLELGHYLADFLEKIGLSSNTGRGKRGDAKRVKQQMERLFNSIISFEYSLQGEARSGKAWHNMQVAPDGVLWWNDKDPDEGNLFGSWIEVGEKFYQAIMANPYPLDIRVLRHIKNSALGIDLYTILNREAYRASKEGKPRFIAWEWLLVQTGNEYASEYALAHFRSKALEQIKQILEVHNGLVVAIQKGCRGQKSGLVISNLSTPSIVPDIPHELPDSGARKLIPSQPPGLSIVAPLPQHTRSLHPATIEQFSEYYPLLNPYDCKYAFDAWQEGLPEVKKAKNYDRAFLGFASKWVLVKV